jgi:hypothetical protein
MLFFHKFFIFKKYFENDLEKYLTCAACVMLATKVCNELRPLSNLVECFLKLYSLQFQLRVSIDEQIIFETGEKLCLIEFEILSAIDFDLNVEIPYKYVIQMKKYFIDYLKNPELMKITSNFINDSFTLPLCLYFDPLLIALASLYLTGYYFKEYFKNGLPDTKEGVKWYHIIDKNIRIEEVKLVSAKINQIYKFCNEAKYSKKKVELVNGKPIIKFESARILNKQENLNESNLDVTKNEMGVEKNVNNNVDTNCPCFS